jgi:hypothetical protein
VSLPWQLCPPGQEKQWILDLEKKSPGDSVTGKVIVNVENTTRPDSTPPRATIPRPTTSTLSTPAAASTTNGATLTPFSDQFGSLPPGWERRTDAQGLFSKTRANSGNRKNVLCGSQFKNNDMASSNCISR